MCSQRLSSQLSKKELRTYFKNQISEFLKRESVEDLISKLASKKAWNKTRCQYDFNKV
jgi:hypothetical protein